MTMSRRLKFIQIVIAVFVGTLANDGIQQFAQQCISKDSNGCAETRIQCVWNSIETTSILHLCLIEQKI